MFITVGDAKIFATSFGSPEAPAILGIGGWIGSWELWAEPFSSLSSNWFTIAFDHRGSGATVAPVASITFDRLVADVFAVLDFYKVQSCLLAAESGGAAIALGAALKAPERISGLVIVDGFCLPNNAEGDDRFLQGLESNYAQTLDWFVEACVPEDGCEHIKRWGRQIIDRASPEAAIALYRMMDTLDVTPDLNRIIQETLIVHGQKDAIVPVEDAKRLAKMLPDAKLVLLKGAGHVPTLTYPNEIVREIRSFFDS